MDEKERLKEYGLKMAAKLEAAKREHAELMKAFAEKVRHHLAPPV